jgi:hypothetical protein
MLSVPWLKENETFNGNNFVDFTKNYKGGDNSDIDFSKWDIVYAEPSIDINTGEVTDTFYRVNSVTVDSNGIVTISR